jgi:hypothetical protein
MAQTTRRDALRFGLGAAVTCSRAFAAKEFWNEKQPAQWTDEEREELLTRSPWAKEPSTNYNGGGGVPGGRTASASRSRRGSYDGSGARGASDSGADPRMPGHFRSVVRWESALPIREANGNKSKDDPAANYILKAIGDLPMLQPNNDESETEYAHRLDMLKQYTKLEKKGEPIYLTNLRYEGKGNDAGALFYFVRNDLITLKDGSVTFVTKLGPIEVKVKFTLHDMIYQGKLEL